MAYTCWKNIYLFSAWLLLVALLMAIVYFLVSEQTYPSEFCNPDLCDFGERHVGCHPIGFALQCVKPRVVLFNVFLKRYIIKLHNELRNQLAAGQTAGLKSAARIGIVTWNNHLAHLAEVNTQHCELRYDECRNTKAYRYVGQNTATDDIGNVILNADRVYQAIKHIINVWFSESENAKQADLDEFNLATGGTIQNFSNIIHERTSKVGCGMTSYYNAEKHLIVLFTCNYSFEPHPKLPIYTSGKSCSYCERGCHTDYPALCGPDEVIYSDLK